MKKELLHHARKHLGVTLHALRISKLELRIEDLERELKLLAEKVEAPKKPAATKKIAAPKE